MSLVLYGRIPYNSNYKTTGIFLAVAIGFHFAISIIWNIKGHEADSENPFHKGKIITGYAIILLFIFHLSNYKNMNLSEFRGIVSLFTEILLIVTCTLHTRFTVATATPSMMTAFTLIAVARFLWLTKLC